MSKTTVTQLFVGSLIAIIGGLVLLCMTVVVGAASGAFTMDGTDISGIQSSGVSASLVVPVAIAVLALIGGGLAQFVAWVGALVNTAELQDKTWFLVVLLLGLLSFGFVALLVYVLAGPDGTASTGDHNGPVGHKAASPGKA
jgi:hypothetical protein